MTCWPYIPIKGTSHTELNKIIPFHQGYHCLMEGEKNFSLIYHPNTEGNFQHLKPRGDCLVDEEEREAEGLIIQRHRGARASRGRDLQAQWQGSQRAYLRVLGTSSQGN